MHHHPVLGPNQWPDQPETFRPVIEEYLVFLKELGRRIMRALALALGGPRDAFEGDRAGDPFWILRVIGYPGCRDIDKNDSSGIGCGEHTDYGLLTFVNQDMQVSALQVLNFPDPIVAQEGLKYLFQSSITNTTTRLRVGQRNGFGLIQYQGHSL
eukprot:TRINITY_DN2877_c0_g1_i3.p1 TRINITY_DN2877_c0_g1~~TRINITY_DN2877_c0_g1_i3.p1  ORF type:complete len:155 (-),score=15.92 TRINITY_DN2877_c0_g1_i3:182-646(-)